MAEQTAKAGTYILTGERFRRKNPKGGYTLFSRGDEVELTADEAARLIGGKFCSFKLKPTNPDTSNDDDDDDDSGNSNSNALTLTTKTSK